ncbi:MAG: hypothetical protein Pars2KO_32420 [Parasphingorhabdus sp.]
MNRADIQNVLNNYYHAFNAKDKNRVLASFSHDADFIDLTMGRNMKGLEQLAEFIDETWTLSPYFRIEPEQILIDGDSVAVQLIMSGAKKVDSAGKPHPKSLWRIPSTSFFKLQENLIIWKADCWNALAIPKQIGWLRTIPMIFRSGT